MKVCPILFEATAPPFREKGLPPLGLYVTTTGMLGRQRAREQREDKTPGISVPSLSIRSSLSPPAEFGRPLLKLPLWGPSATSKWEAGLHSGQGILGK